MSWRCRLFHAFGVNQLNMKLLHFPPPEVITQQQLREIVDLEKDQLRLKRYLGKRKSGIVKQLAHSAAIESGEYGATLEESFKGGRRIQKLKLL
jgi:hypothetical protein